MFATRVKEKDPVLGQERQRLIRILKSQRALYVRVNFEDCSSCAGAVLGTILPEKDVQGYVYWHEQDEERIWSTGKVNLRYGGKKGGDETTRLIGETVAVLLRQNDFTFQWNGDPNTTITVNLREISR